MNKPVAGRSRGMADTTAEPTEVLAGSIERVTNKVFLLSPPNVDVGDEARAQIAQDPFYNHS